MSIVQLGVDISPLLMCSLKFSCEISETCGGCVLLLFLSVPFWFLDAFLDIPFLDAFFGYLFWILFGYLFAAGESGANYIIYEGT